MLRPLLSVLLVKLADVGLGDQHLGQDLVSGRGPHEGSRVAVPVRDVVPDPADQCLHRCERAVADRLAGDDNAEPVLDLAEPGGSDRGEMEVHIGVLGQPGFDVSAFVGGQVAQYDVHSRPLYGSTATFDERQEVGPLPGRLATARSAAVVADRAVTSRPVQHPPPAATTDPPRPPTQSTTQAVKPNPSRPSVVRSVRNPGLSESSDDFLNRRSQFRRKMHIPG